MQKIRKAIITDVKKIQHLINLSAEKKFLLPRSLNDIFENIRDFCIYEENETILACCALHIVWEDLAEIRSLVVKDEYKKKGLGKKLVTFSLEEAKNFGIKKVFALTYQDKFFEKLNFKRIEKDSLPHKIWKDCMNCVKFPDCDEIAMMIEQETEYSI